MEEIVRTYIRTAKIYFEQENFFKAHFYFRKCCKLNSSNATMWVNLGFTSLHLGLYHKAYECLQKAIKLGLSPEIEEFVREQVTAYSEIIDFLDIQQQIKSAEAPIEPEPEIKIIGREEIDFKSLLRRA